MLLRSASLKTLGVETCTRTGMSTGLTAFTTTHRVIDRVHNDTTVVGAASEPAAAACLTALLECVVGVADYAYGCAAGQEDFAGLARRELDDRIVTLT